MKDNDLRYKGSATKLDCPAHGIGCTTIHSPGVVNPPTLEETNSRIANALERIADALELSANGVFDASKQKGGNNDQ